MKSNQESSLFKYILYPIVYRRISPHVILHVDKNLIFHYELVNHNPGLT